MKTIAIIGAGGFAREVELLIRDINDYGAMSESYVPWKFAGFLADKSGPYDSPTLGDFSWLERNHLDALVIGIGNPRVRFDLGYRLKQQFPSVEWPVLIHPNSLYDCKSCHFAEGVIIQSFNELTVNISVGRFSVINAMCCIGHETTIGEGVVINSLCAISGGVKIGDRVLVGAHSFIMQYKSVGDDATVGAGAMVNKDVPAGVTVVGVPARSR